MISTSEQNRSSHDIDYRLYRPGDVSVINNFYNDSAERPGASSHNYVPRTDIEWMWEFDPNETGTPSYVLAHHDKRLVGIQAFIRIDMVRNGIPFRTEKSEDTLVSPSYRRQGILNEMYRILLEKAQSKKIQTQWGFTNIPQALYRSGYKNLGTVRILKADLNPVISLRSRINKLDPCGSPLKNLPANLLKVPRLAWSYIWGSIKRSKEIPLPGDVIIEEPGFHIPEGEALSVQFSELYGGISPHVTPAYLKWRCVDNPYYRYKTFTSRDGTDLNGLAIFKLDQPAGIAFLSVLVALPTKTDTVDRVVNALLKEGLDYLKRKKYKYILAWEGTAHPFSRILNLALNRFGFMDTGDGIDFVVRKVRADDPAIFDPDEWFICEIMSER